MNRRQALTTILMATAVSTKTVPYRLESLAPQAELAVMVRGSGLAANAPAADWPQWHGPQGQQFSF